jgi:hypothetical protein
MTRSESIAELAKALCKAQGAMLFAKKDSANPFFKSKYADLASVVEAAKKPLAENGLSYIQMPRADAAGVTVETLLMHVSGEWIASDLFMVPVKGDPQGVGSCITYARRYSLQAMLGIPAEDDDGNAASGKTDNKMALVEKPNGTTRPAKLTLEQLQPEQRERIESLAIEVFANLVSNKPVAAVQAIEMAHLENDDKLLLWDLFDSKQRRTLKETADQVREMMSA